MFAASPVYAMCTQPVYALTCMCESVFVKVTCPTGPGCDLGFHLLILGLRPPVAIRFQPTTQQMPPDTKADTDSSYVHMSTFSISRSCITYITNYAFTVNITKYECLFHKLKKNVVQRICLHKRNIPTYITPFVEHGVYVELTGNQR